MTNQHGWELKNFLPEDPNEILALQPDEVAECLLAYVAAKPERGVGALSAYSFGVRSRQDFPRDQQNEIALVLAEGWAWLVRECLLIQDLGDMNQGFVLSRRGRLLAESGNFEQFRAERSLSREQLHPTIAERAYSDFIRSDYEGAVFKAMREVEIAVREAGDYPNALIGNGLMRTAFHPETGALRDAEAEDSERQAMSHLFAGAIGLYKNPSSHRPVDLEASTAVEILTFASHLMRIVDERREARPQK
jgi:uncharacterized protein (TIGR02391 family)